MSSFSSMQKIPPEILQAIFTLLRRRDVAHARLVSRLWSAVVFPVFFHTLRIRIGLTRDDYIFHLASMPAACACIRELAIWSDIDSSDPPDRTPFQLHPLAGMLNNVSSIVLSFNRMRTKHWGEMAAFLTASCSAVTRICIGGALTYAPFKVDAFLSALPHLACVCLYQAVDIPPWPFVLRHDLAGPVVNLSVGAPVKRPFMIPAWNFPALRTLDLHLDMVFSVWNQDTSDAIAITLTDIITRSAALDLIRFPSPIPGLSPVSTIFAQLIRVHPHRELTLVLGGWHDVPLYDLDDMRAADGLVQREAPGARYRIMLSYNTSSRTPNMQDIMPHLHGRGLIGFSEGLRPPHDHF